MYQLVPGTEERSYGLNVARLANIPEKIIQRASFFSNLLEHDVIDRQSSHLLLQLLASVSSSVRI